MRSIPSLVPVFLVTPLVTCVLVRGAWAGRDVASTVGTIVFQSNRDGNNEIYSMNADGTDVSRLTEDPASDENAALSYDGTKVAFVSHRSGSAHLYSINPDGTDVLRLTDGALDLNPGWSPNGRKIAFSSQIGSSLEMAVMSSDGTRKQVVTNDPALDAQPHWSPNGRKIAFIHDYRIVVLVRGGGVTELTDLPLYEWPALVAGRDQDRLP